MKFSKRRSKKKKKDANLWPFLSWEVLSSPWTDWLESRQTDKRSDNQKRLFAVNNGGFDFFFDEESFRSSVASEWDECRTDRRMRWEVEKDRRVESFSDRREATRLLLLLLLCDAHCSAEIHSISVCKGRPEVQKARNPEDQKSRRPNGQKSRWPWSVGWFSDNQSQLQPDILYAVLKCYFYGKVKGNSIVATGNITLLDIGCR